MLPKKLLITLAVMLLVLPLVLLQGCSQDENPVEPLMQNNEEIDSDQQTIDEYPFEEWVGISADSINVLGRAAMPADQDKGTRVAQAAGWQLYVHVPFYSQRDPNWSWHPLGWSDLTIGDYGCHITCVAMLYAKWGHGNMTPTAVSSWGRHNGGFSGPNAIADKIIDYGGNRNARYISASQIYSELRAGHPVIYEIYYGNGSHFMVIFAFDGSRYWVKDPWKDWTQQDQPLYGSLRSLRVYGY